jgi:hypothetical protein
VGTLPLRSPSPRKAKTGLMKETKAEKLYMLRLWQEEGEEAWHASLKPVGQAEGTVRYFHSLESLVKFLKGLGLQKNKVTEQ